MSEATWFYERDGERIGPVSTQDLNRLKVAGTIRETTLVWQEGMDDWRPFAEALVGSAHPSPPPVPRCPPPMSSTPGAPIVTPPSREPAAVREVRLREDFDPRLGSLLGRSWKLIMTDFWPFLGCYLLTMIIFGFASQLLIPVFFLTFPLMTGLAWYYLLRLRGRASSVDDLFFGFKRRFGDLAILNLLVSIPFALLFVVFFVVLFLFLSRFFQSAPDGGTISVLLLGTAVVILVFSLVVSAVCVVTNFACLIMVDEDLGWQRSLEMAWAAARPRLVKLTLIYFAIMLLAQAGILLLYFGVFLTGLWSMVALTILYEDAFGRGMRENDTETAPTFP